MEDLLKELLPSGLANVFENTFRNIEVAEELIAEKKREHPDKAELLDSAFMALCTPELLQGKHPDLYKHHVNELLGRVIDGITGVKFSYGTRAEALCAIMVTALRAPLAQDYSALAGKLFVEIFGRMPPGAESVTHESYPGAADEILSDICRTKLRDPGRMLRR